MLGRRGVEVRVPTLLGNTGFCTHSIRNASLAEVAPPAAGLGSNTAEGRSVVTRRHRQRGLVAGREPLARARDAWDVSSRTA